MSSDSDVISETPEKVKVVKKPVCKKRKKVPLASIDYKCSLAPIQSDDLLPPKPYLKTLNTRVHVFHEIPHILEYSKEKWPVNNNLKTLGVFSDNSLQIYDSTCKDTPLKLDFKGAKSPEDEEIVEVFGYLELIKKDIIFVVNFWKKFTGDFGAYLKLQRFLRSQAPKECFEVQNLTICSDTILDFENLNYASETINDTNVLLLEKAEEIEKLLLVKKL